jgi:glucokinase
MDLENDANAAAFAEIRFGAGRGKRNLIYLTISTGIGAGLVLNEEIYRGANGTAGELGHVTVDANAPIHPECGMPGCLEMMASGAAIARMANEAVRKEKATLLSLAADRRELTAKDVAEAAEEDDPVACEILETVANYLGVGLAGFINIFNPDVIVIGGGLSYITSLVNRAETRAKELAFPLPASTVSFTPPELEGRAEALGAAALARQRLERSQ